MNKYITIDPVKKILIHSGFEAIPVVKDKKWRYNDEEASSECWRAMNVGHQGEKLIEGSILDYIVEDIYKPKEIHTDKELITQLSYIFTSSLFIPILLPC